ncbi:hypothetical protein [Reyranella sp.]|uniref:F0F1 ATP synthase subunit B family protein n=1 Tax=Reyranella sp. TaxID=1929291 RepID=UPI003BAC713D
MPVQAPRTWASASVAVFLLAAGPVLAAEETGKSGMPQFDVSRFPSQIFWLVVCFAVLYFLMSKLVLPGIGKTMEERERKIQGDLDAAQKANDVARAAAADQEKALGAARGEASQVLRAASEAAAGQTSARMHEIADKLAADIAAAERRIADQRNQAMAGLTGMSAEIASAVMSKLVGPADAAQVANAVDAAAKAGKT